jgi:hypothetical protein
MPKMNDIFNRVLGIKSKEPLKEPLPETLITTDELLIQYFVMRNYMNYLKEVKKTEPEKLLENEYEYNEATIKMFRQEIKLRFQLIKSLANKAFDDLMLRHIEEGGFKH